MAWQVNMDIQSVFNEYKVVAYMCSYFSKLEDHCLASIKQVVKDKTFMINEKCFKFLHK